MLTRVSYSCCSSNNNNNIALLEYLTATPSHDKGVYFRHKHTGAPSDEAAVLSEETEGTLSLISTLESDIQ